MAKRRTKKQKLRAKNLRKDNEELKINWKPSVNNRPAEASVKSQNGSAPENSKPILGKTKISEVTAKVDSLTETRTDIFKSLRMASLVLALELMIYLAWSKY